jgi:hypothetical protein
MNDAAGRVGMALEDDNRIWDIMKREQSRLRINLVAFVTEPIA